MQVRLIAKTIICNEDLLKELKSNSPEALVMYCARVSNPNNQTSGNPKLIKHCVDEKHVSIFEMSDMIVEIETSRAIAAQILRHKSFSFQEFSQRYAKAQGFEKYKARRQDNKNRQSSIDDLDGDIKVWFEEAQNDINNLANSLYNQALDKQIAKEQARFLLPLSTKTRLYMKGNVRSWINYLQVRIGNGTQLEHQDIANEIKKIFVQEFPIISEALNWA